VLLWKQRLQAVRNLRATIAITFSPVAVCLILSAFQLMSNAVLDRPVPHPVAVPIATALPRAICAGGAPNCTTLMYAPKGVAWVEDIARTLAAQNGLAFGTDVVGLPGGTTSPSSLWCLDDAKHPIPSDEYIPVLDLPKPAYLERVLQNGSFPNPCDYFRDNATMQEYMLANPNATQNAVLFTPAYIKLPAALPQGYNLTVGYSLFYNITVSKFPIRGSDHALEAMRALDTAVLSLRSGNADAVVEAEIAPFPEPPSRLANYDVVSNSGAVWFPLPGLILFFSLAVDLVTEKELKLRVGLMFQGMQLSAYWGAWITTGVVLSALSTAVLLITTAIAHYTLFANTDLAILVTIFFAFSLSMVAFAFFISSILNTRKQAQTTGYAVILVGFVFQTIIATGNGALIDLLFASDVAWWVVLIRCALQMYPPFNWANCFFDISSIAGKHYHYTKGSVSDGDFFGWSNATVARNKTLQGTPVVIPPMVDSVYLLLANTVVYFTLAWYFDSVLSSENNGNPQHPLFCLSPAYWQCMCHRQKRASEGARSSSPTTVAVSVQNLVKEYTSRSCCLCCCSFASKNVKAVDNLSMDFEVGKITALLGHNGAGKSTLIGVLTGLFPSTSGHVTLFGKNVSDAEEMASIHAISGVCPQHDILWNNLTAFEHGVLFATIKGVAPENVDDEVRQRLSFVGLLEQAAVQKVGTFSGGMKRRLSVALATIGDPKFLVLDEPTTGMDPVNRRAVWSLILKLRKSRCIIVTTHHMAEADCLGDVCGVMAFGKLLAAADPLKLKNTHGSGYTLSIVLASEELPIQALADSLISIVSKVKLSEREGRAVKFLVPQDKVSAVPELLRVIEKAHASGIVREWGVSDSTLESAFLNLTKESGFDYGDDESEALNMATHGGEEKTSRTFGGGSSSSDSITSTRRKRIHNLKLTATPRRDAFLAVLKKNFKLQSRQRCSNVCQILTPVLMMMLLWLLQAVIISQVPNQSQSVTLPAIPYPLNSPGLASILDSRNDQSSSHGAHCLEFFWTTSNSLNETVYEDLLGKLADASSQRNCSLGKHHHNVTIVPFFEGKPSWDGIQADILDGMEMLQDASVNELNNIFSSLNFRTPDGAVEFLAVDKKDPPRVRFRFSINDAGVALYHRPNGFTRLASRYANLYDGDVSLLISQGKMAMYALVAEGSMDYVSSPRVTSSVLLSGLFDDLGLHEQASNFLETTLGLKIAISMPEVKSESILAIVEIFGSFLYPMALTLQLPVYSFLIVLEKETRFRELSKIMGQKSSTYWASTLVFNLSIYAVVAACFWGAGAFLKLRFFVQTSGSLLFCFLLLWGLALSAMSMLISAFVSSSRVSTVVGWVVVLFGNGIALILSDGIYGDIPQLSVSSRLPTFLLLNPQFAMVRGIYLMNWRCSAKLHCYKIEEFSADDELATCMFFMLFDFVVYFALALYLDEVLPSQWGVPKHPCWCIKSSEAKKSSSELTVSCPTEPLTGEDLDVFAERRRVKEFVRLNRSPPVLVSNICKNFYSGGRVKKAVANLSLAVEKGSVLGLLGENGAGKTTFMSVLIGLLTPSDGGALIAGENIRTDIDDARLQTGFCPQHDVLLGEMSAREHLVFFAQMKGVARCQIQQHVDDALRDVGLLQFQHRPSGQLSGGMKRRLQIAVSLIGQSSVVFLDEPTTGLDPSSRRAIWAIIRRVRQQADRAILISTHLMDEAEYLSSRIAIMSHGRLRCLAGQQRLKTLYGNGYKIVANYSENDRDRADALVQKVCKDCSASCEKIQSFDGQATWRFDQIDADESSSCSEFAVSKVFEGLNCTASEAGITDWAMGQVTLDDCFSLIVQQYRS
jgi:ABC-type multidrug transport system ATPase subunit